LAYPLHLSSDMQPDFSRELQFATGCCAKGLCNYIGAHRAEEDVVLLLLDAPPCILGGRSRKASPAPPLPQRLVQALELAQGLAYLHRRRAEAGAATSFYHTLLSSHSLRMTEQGTDMALAHYAFTDFRDAKKPSAQEAYYKAPELLKTYGKPPDPTLNGEKADVYSYAIILWEILTQKTAYQEYTTLSDLFVAVRDEKNRPSIPEDCGDKLGALLSECWAAAPETRPTFAEIESAFNEVLLEVLIEDSFAREFWANNFLGQQFVKWPIFLEKFYAFLKVPQPKGKAKDIYGEALRAVIMDIGDCDGTEVSMEVFGKIMDWFGPLEGPGILDKIAELLNQAWFHGKLQGKDAEERVAHQDRGAFLFRFSATEPGCYAITVHTKRDQAKHYRVYHKPGTNYLIGKSECGSLLQIVLNFNRQLYLRKPCPGSKFTEVFRKHNIEMNRYSDWSDDDDGNDSDNTFADQATL